MIYKKIPTNTSLKIPDVVVIIPIKTISEANSSEHWSKKRKRHHEQKFITFVKCKDDVFPHLLPCQVTLTRIAPRKLDSDNLTSALKWIRDAISDMLIPGKAAGQADSDPRITWIYAQQKGKPKEYSVGVCIIKD